MIIIKIVGTKGKKNEMSKAIRAKGDHSHRWLHCEAEVKLSDEDTEYQLADGLHIAACDEDRVPVVFYVFSNIFRSIAS